MVKEKGEKLNWYNRNIEKPIRDLVKLLRENGFNTVCSCGHDMYVQCQCIPDGELQRLHNLLFENYKDYEINILLQCNKGVWYTTTTVKTPDKGERNDR